MLRICYTSRACDVGDTAQLARITDVSVLLNHRDRISGLLLFDGRHFLQALEGPHESVRACFDRIRRDARHFDIRVIFDTGIVRREFGDWSMRQRLFDPADRDMFRKTVMQDVAAVSDMNLSAFFVGFATIGQD